MPGFTYYFPNLDSLAADDLRHFGASYALDARRTTRTVHNGPDGGDGLLACRGDTLPEYAKDRQTWRKIPGAGAWVGMSASAAPRPEDLTREKTFNGHWITLLDGQAWLCPAARRWVEEDGELRWYCPLPQRATLGDDGHWQAGEVISQYSAVWELARRWETTRICASIETGDGTARQSFAFDDLLGGAVQSLGVNYVVGPAEADLLGILSQEMAVAIMDALADFPTRLAWLKKNADADPAGTITEVGSAA